ncbi:MAG: hypothetical protein RJA99_179 [Pseudomonadota bacterium]|jgi:hypothetical protein
MRLSRYFHELRVDYEAELDDLRTDSEGGHVLDRRLADKRREFAALLPMLEVAPVMLAPAFHRAFDFAAASRERLAALLAGEPGEFPSWAELAAELGVAGWARPLVDRVLAEAGGEDFLATAVALEFLTHASGAALPASASSADADGDGEGRRERGEDDEHDGLDDEDGEALGEDFLEQQGFDRRTEP